MFKKAGLELKAEQGVLERVGQRDRHLLQQEMAA